MIKFNMRIQFNLTDIINKNVKAISKQAHSYFDDRIKHIDELISDSQEWLNSLNFEFSYASSFSKISKQAHFYFDESLNYISTKFENSNIKKLSRQACLYFDERVKNIDINILKKQEWLNKKTGLIADLIKNNQVRNNKRIILLDDKHAGFILEKLNTLHFINHTDFPLLFLIKFIRRLLELIQLSKVVSMSKKKYYSLEFSQIKIVRAPPFA